MSLDTCPHFPWYPRGQGLYTVWKPKQGICILDVFRKPNLPDTFCIFRNLESMFCISVTAVPNDKGNLDITCSLIWSRPPFHNPQRLSGDDYLLISEGYTLPHVQDTMEAVFKESGTTIHFPNTEKYLTEKKKNPAKIIFVDFLHPTTKNQLREILISDLISLIEQYVNSFEYCFIRSRDLLFLGSTTDPPLEKHVPLSPNSFYQTEFGRLSIFTNKTNIMRTKTFETKIPLHTQIKHYEGDWCIYEKRGQLIVHNVLTHDICALSFPKITNFRIVGLAGKVLVLEVNSTIIWMNTTTKVTVCREIPPRTVKKKWFDTSTLNFYFCISVYKGPESMHRNIYRMSPS